MDTTSHMLVLETLAKRGGDRSLTSYQDNKDIAAVLDIDLDTLNDRLVYLQQKGYVDYAPAFQGLGAARLTAAGADSLGARRTMAGGSASSQANALVNNGNQFGLFFQQAGSRDRKPGVIGRLVGWLLSVFRKGGTGA